MFHLACCTWGLMCCVRLISSFGVPMASCLSAAHAQGRGHTTAPMDVSERSDVSFFSPFPLFPHLSHRSVMGSERVSEGYRDEIE